MVNKNVTQSKQDNNQNWVSAKCQQTKHCIFFWKSTNILITKDKSL